jgi:hypothetical protein
MPRPQFRVWIDPNPDEPLEEMTAEITEDGELRLTSVYDRSN